MRCSARGLRRLSGIESTADPLAAYQRLLRSCTELLGGTAGARAAQLLSKLCALHLPEAELPELRAAHGDSKVMAGHLLWALTELLRASCGRTPLLWVLDDLQWGDALSISLIDRVQLPPRPAARGRLQPARRSLLHKSAADYFQRTGEPDALVLAEQYSRSSEPFTAARYFARAAPQLLEGNDLAGCRACVERGLGCQGPRARQDAAERVVRGELLGLQTMLAYRTLELAGVVAAGTEALELLPTGSASWCKTFHSLSSSAMMLGRTELLQALGQRFLTVDAGPAVYRAVPDRARADPLFCRSAGGGRGGGAHGAAPAGDDPTGGAGRARAAHRGAARRRADAGGAAGSGCRDAPAGAAGRRRLDGSGGAPDAIEVELAEGRLDRARADLRLALATLQARAAQIPDASCRHGYLQNLRENVRLRALGAQYLSEDAEPATYAGSSCGADL